MRQFITLIEKALLEGDSPEDRAIIADMLTRAPAKWREWALENGATPEDLTDPELTLSEFEYWLQQERSIKVEDGRVQFWTLDNLDARLIANHPVELCHFTSSSRVRSIKRYGLVPDKRSVNRRQSDGVYLTTECSGPAVTGYIRNALRNTRAAYGVQLTIRTFLSEISPDPDDEDISSGRHQFVTNHVSPEQIVSIDRAGW